MKISTKLRYSSRLLIALAERNGVVSTSELGERLGVSPLYLRPIAIELEKEGIIRSHRGAKGGYELVKHPTEVTFLEVARIHENLNLVPCIKDPDSCPFTKTCRTRKLWIQLKECIENFLKNTTLEDLLKEDK